MKGAMEGHWRHYHACTNRRGEMCYSEGVVRDGFGIRTSSVCAVNDKGQGYGVFSFPFVFSLQRAWQVWKEWRSTSSPLQWAPNGARMLAGTTTWSESSWKIRWVCY
jgi:hypothetical protein